MNTARRTPERLTDLAIARIKEMIAGGKLQPGQRLAREQDLARELGLSRNSLREAVRALTLINVLEARQGDGTYVTSLEPRLLLDGVAFATHLMRDRQLLEVWEVRRLLEPAAAAFAAARMSAEQHAGLRARLEQLRTAADVDELMRADEEFHRYICEAAGNSVLASMLETLSSQTLRARALRKATDDHHRAAVFAEHEPIYEAIVARDPDLARAAAAVHVADGELWLRRSLGS